DMATTLSLKRIVVGVDGSDSAKSALEFAARLAKAMRSEIVAVHAFDAPIALPDPYAIPFYLDDKWRAGLKSEFEHKWLRPLKTAGVKDRALLVGGQAAALV